LLFFWINKRLSLKVFKFCIFALIIFDLWVFGSKYIVANEVKKCYWDEKVVAFLKKDEPPQNFRVISFNYIDFYPNKAIHAGIQLLDGYDAILLERYTGLFSLCQGQPIDSPRNLRLVSLANLKYIIMPKGEKLHNPVLRVVYETDNAAVWRNPQSLPRTYIVHGVEVMGADKDKILNTLLDKHFDPLSTVILEEEPSVHTGVESLPQQVGESVKVLRYCEDEVVIQAVLQKDGFLVLSDTYYPGWRADVTDTATKKERQVKILQANYLFRAVPLTKGEHIIRFRFRPTSFYIGSLVSALTVLAVATVACGNYWSGLQIRT
jgi:hypothetical protein